MAKRKTFDEVNAEAQEAARSDSPIQVTQGGKYGRWSCYAHGCPAFASACHGADAMICCFHMDVAPERWPAITQKLRELEPLVDLVICVSSHSWSAKHPDWARRAVVVIDSLDLDEDLYPRWVELHHGKARDGTNIVVRRDEHDHPLLYGMRMRSWIRGQLYDETAEGEMRGRKLSRQEQAVALGQVIGKIDFGTPA